MGVAPNADGIQRVTGRPTVLLTGTFDTKGEEYAFVRSAILDRGLGVLAMDIGVLGDDASRRFPVDIAAEQVAREGGSTLEALRAGGDRGSAVAVMQAGARALTRELYRTRRFDGMLALGGGGGTTMITAAMRELPVGVPKVMVSTMASGNAAPYVDVKDITMMYSVVDIAGLNPILRRVLSNAVGAVCGMLQGQPDGGRGVATGGTRPAIAATMFGVTTPCVTAARKRLEAAGYDVVVFHATGSGGRAMEGLIDDGYFAGVLDVTTTEWCDEVVGGVLSAGPQRLSAAARTGIPQVVSVGALDMVNFGAMETVPSQFRNRRLHEHNPQVTLMRTTPEECKGVGEWIGERLNLCHGPVRFLIPELGVSALDAPGQPFYEPEADAALFSALERSLRQSEKRRLIRVPLHINDPRFAELLVANFQEALHER